MRPPAREDKYNEKQFKMKNALAIRLKRCRNAKKLSHEKLAKELKEKHDLDISAQALKNYEVSTIYHARATTGFGMNILFLWTFAKYFEVTTDYLLGLSEFPEVNEDMQAATKKTGLKPKTINKIRELTRKGQDSDGKSASDCIYPMHVVLGDIIEHKDFNLAMQSLYQLGNSILRNDTEYVLSDRETRKPELEAIGHFIKGTDVKRMYAVYARDHINNVVQAFIDKFTSQDSWKK